MGRKPVKHFNLPRGMRARTRQRKNGETITYYFYETNQHGKRKEISLGKDYLVAMQQWLKLEQDKIPIKGTGITFTMVAMRYKNDVIPKKKPKTARENIYQLNKLLEFFGGVNPAPLNEIRPEHIKQYFEWRKDAKVAANREISLFNHIWTMCLPQNWDYIQTPSPAKGVQRNKEEPREVYIEDYLYEILYEYADQTMKDALDIAYLIGQRPADVLKIQVHHIRDDILLIKQNKTDKKIHFHISGSLKEIIDRRLQTAKIYLLCNRSGKALTVNAMEKRFAKIRRQAMAAYPELTEEIIECQFRDLRAKSGTDVYLQKETIESAQRQLGHASTKMTRRYIRRDKAVKPLDFLRKK